MYQVHLHAELLVQMFRQVLCRIYGAVLSAGAAEADRQIGEAAFHVALHGSVDKGVGMLQEYGYLAVVFSYLVGSKGHVDLHNTPGWIAQFPTMEPDVQKTALKQPNIAWVTVPWNDLTAPDNTYDVILLGRVSGTCIVGRPA